MSEKKKCKTCVRYHTCYVRLSFYYTGYVYGSDCQYESIGDLKKRSIER